MKTAKYTRSEIYTWDNLTTREKERLEGHEESFFVDDPCEQTGDFTPLPLDMFIMTDSKIWHGVYSQTAFSGYFICISKCGTQAVVAYKYC